MGSKWNKQQTLSFIEILQNYHILYDSGDPDYLNKVKRQNAYEALMTEIKKFKDNITIIEIKSKVKTLRTQFGKERQKVLNSMKSGAGEEEIYEPKLWCYEELSFLNSFVEGDEQESNFNQRLLTETSDSNTVFGSRR